jgi:hypothetical protein
VREDLPTTTPSRSGPATLSKAIDD